MLDNTPTVKSIYRSVYRAQLDDERDETTLAGLRACVEQQRLGMEQGDLMTISLFRWRAHLFCYWESVERETTPEAIFGPINTKLTDWPGGMGGPRQWVPMMDIYHCLEPISVEDWRRKRRNDQISGKVARLNSDWVSSYIFYHYQYQEEQPGVWAKYGLITLHEDLIFFYQEMPYVIEAPRRVGKLQTHNTPEDWQAVMYPHFNQWTDAPTGQEIWRDVELVVHRGITP